MAIYLFKWHLTGKVDTEKNHTSYPEEEDIPACFKET
jgi:hypothetical protein